ncbi:lysophospholipase L1-like esterase [Angulomicrobium tetraedrale]|uniref:Lysophospholipase L1-like esterase n=1 Tax=Ancylobacter tetraedralis TaxID=217068 RepID=A0A839ZBD0_9HYPH|nr:SGNH/GDSL hydrolase family protein [Ancylobacter tetraedralis]MBB3772090.1 lysophospholipase L1-like esterase [Ancylobacter tetraedralis]
MRLLALAIAATLVLAPLTARPATAQSSSTTAAPIPQAAQILPPSCPATKTSTRLSAPLARTAARLRAGQPVTIVAIGSSSTAGAGATSAAASYPSRLQAALRERFPGADITVINRGVNGQDAPEMLARFDADVAAAKPTLVIWQAGVNALFRANGLATAGPELREAIARIRALDADLVLVDPQYSPRVIADADTGAMIRLIDAVASEEGVDVYHRYALMRDWHEAGRMPFESFLAKDGFHMNDWGYDCFARDLGRSMAANIDAQQRAADITPSASRSSAKPSASPAKSLSAPVSITP